MLIHRDMCQSSIFVSLNTKCCNIISELELIHGGRIRRCCHDVMSPEWFVK